MTYQEAIFKLSAILDHALTRCEHCGKEDGVFVCDECQNDVIEWVATVTDLVNAIQGDPFQRVIDIVQTTAPISGRHITALEESDMLP